MTEEDDTVEDVSRDADAEEEGINVAKEDVLYGQESVNGDDVIVVVPRNKGVYVTIAFAVTMVHLNLHCRRLCISDLAGVLPHTGYFMFYSVPRISNEQTDLFSVMFLLIVMTKSANQSAIVDHSRLMAPLVWAVVARVSTRSDADIFIVCTKTYWIDLYR